MERLHAAGVITSLLAAGPLTGLLAPTIKLSKGSDSSLSFKAALTGRLRISAACCAATAGGEWRVIALRFTGWL
jgi:hypothetical protein